MGNLATNWLKRIFSVTTITTIATVLAACIAVIEFTERNGGSFIAVLNNKEAISPLNRTILVYIDKDSADLTQIGIVPQITNPSKYSLQDVLLKYKVEISDADVSYTDFFSIHRFSRGYEVTNIDKTLYAKSEMPEPFYSFIMKANGQAFIDLWATYKGADEPFIYKAKIYAKNIIIKNKEERNNVIFQDAYHFTTQNKINNIDIIIINGGNVELYEDMISDSLMVSGVEKQEAISNPMPVEQIEAKNKDFIRAAKEKDDNTWFEILIMILMLLIIGIGFVSVLFLLIKYDEWDRIGRVKAIVGMNASIIFVYTCVFYSKKLLDDPVSGGYFLGLLGVYFVISGFFVFSKFKSYLEKRFKFRESNAEATASIIIILLYFLLFSGFASIYKSIS